MSEDKKYKVEEIKLKIAGEHELDATIHRPEDKNQTFPAVLICHGYLSSKEEAGDFPQKLAEKGYIVLSFDFSGHGQSQGDRGYYRSITHIDDSERALKKLLEQEGVQKDNVHVIGHSMGTVATSRLLTESELGKKCKTGILMAPVRKFSDMAGKVELKAYQMVASIAWPVLLLTSKHMYLPFKVKTKDIFLDQKTASDYDKLGLLQKNMPINNYYYLIKQVDNERFASKISQPVLMLLAKQDNVVPNWSSKKVFEVLQNKNKKLVEIDNSGHSMMMDYSKGKVFDEVFEWLLHNK